MRSRTAGMGWGTAIEAPAPGALARFSSALLDRPIGHEEAGTAIVAAPEGPIYLVFQQAAGYQAPVWPPADGAQRVMMHFDVQVGDLEAVVAEAVALGATVATVQPTRTSGCSSPPPATPSASAATRADRRRVWTQRPPGDGVGP